MKLVCMARSKKHGGQCVACLDPDSGLWVRPVAENGPLTSEDICYADGVSPNLLDIVDVPLEQYTGDEYQIENYLISGAAWTHMGRFPYEKLSAFSYGQKQMLHTTSDRVPAKTKTARASLALIEPDGVVRFYKKARKGRETQIRASFLYAGVSYDLSVTDMCFRSFFLSHEEDDASTSLDMYFTISLGRPFKSDGLSSFQYKFVAGVIPRPGTKLWSMLFDTGR